MKEERVTSIIKNVSGKNAISGKISIPNSWLIKMGIDIENKEKIKLTFDFEEKRIILTPNIEKEFENNFLTDNTLIEVIKELLNFINHKVETNERTTKGCGELKYPIYSNKNLKNEFIYKGFVVKGNVGKGSLSKENVGIYFLKGNNKISNGTYIFLNYLYEEKKTISIRLGSSLINQTQLKDDDKKKFNDENEVKFYNTNADLNFNEVISEIHRLLDKYNEKF